MLTHTTQAVLLLTAHFSRPAAGDPKPLSPAEWGRFALWLKDRGHTPEALLAEDPARLLDGWADERIPQERIGRLLSRSSALALALEKWQRAGLWVVTRSDPDYPVRLKRLLRNSSPPLFFGCGERPLMNRGGLAVIGSRNASARDLDFARRLGGETAAAGCSLVSGAARGIDESAMLGAIEKEGTAVGVLADRLLGAATSSRFRSALMAGNLVLISPFSPEAGFDVGNAMARNKYIYGLADAAVVVHSGTTGGTWSGALENLKNDWVPLWVKPTDDPGAGNAQLAAKGARWLPGEDGPRDIRQLFDRPVRTDGPSQAGDRFDPPAPPEKIAVREDRSGFAEADALETATAPGRAGRAAVPRAAEGFKLTEAGDADGPGDAETDEWEVCRNMTLYEFFLRRMEVLTSREARTVEELLAELDISRTQLNAWLKQATEDGKLKKKTKPRLRYAWLPSDPKPRQGTIF
jgi:predicted Rossmann fold nucleotide-binding protein DprA/Smf involved in DNA uptake